LEEVKVGLYQPAEVSAPRFNVWTKFKKICDQINKATILYISEAPITKKALTETTSMTSEIYYNMNPISPQFKLTFNLSVSGAFNLSID
jgi:hypothetical protein